VNLRELPTGLVKDLRRRHVIPFVGSGVSRSVVQRLTTGVEVCAFPTWGELLDAACKRLADNGQTPHSKIVSGLLELKPPAYLDAAKYAQQGLGSQWLLFLKEQLDKPLDSIDIGSLVLPRLLWEINSLLITTNYDHVLKWACPLDDSPEEWNIQHTKRFVELLKGELTMPTVWHLHGTVSNMNDVILTQDGYDHLYTSESAKFKYQAALTRVMFESWV
jgi:SIR2-like domain